MNDLQASRINELEVEINFHKNKAAHHIIEVGKRLKEAKELVPHGEWQNWLSEKVEFSDRSARKMIQIADEFSKWPPATDLNLSQLTELLSVPREDREGFLEENNIEDMTRKELRQAIKDYKQAQAEIEELKEENQLLKNKEPEIIEIEKEVEVIKEVKPDDYEEAKASNAQLKERIAMLEHDVSNNERQIKNLLDEKETLERKASMNDEEVEKYNKLRADIEALTKQKSDIGRRIRASKELIHLNAEIRELLQKKLAPMMYIGAINEIESSEVVLGNLEDTLEMVEDWLTHMRGILPKRYDGDAVEVFSYE